MRLKSLEIQGYKSFANKSVFSFDQGIIAVVGPNGSGKSNVADAIRWVLGEQSFSNLRGHKTADMIFAGSTGRARMGMAYVSLVLDNSDGSLPIDYNEVTISRRAFRSGENEYLINNNRVRLKDVTELLARGGLARQTYTVIGQGTIDRALSLRAEERRQLFEEAAGITYHRRRRAETLRRLDQTHNNLIRVNDIVKEIEPRLKRLKRQAEKVERYEQIRLHLDGLLKVWYGYQWRQKQNSLHRARVRETINAERLREEQEKLTLLDAEIRNLRNQQMELRGQLGDWHAQSSKLHRQAESLQRELAVGEERARQLSAQREELITDIQALEERIVYQRGQVSRATQNLAEIDQKYQESENARNAAKKNLKAHHRQREGLQHKHRQAAERAQKAAHAITDRQSRLAQLAERNRDLAAQKEEQENQIQTLQTRQLEAETALEAVNSNMAELENNVAATFEEENVAIRRRQKLTEAAQTLNAQRVEQEKALASLIARQDLLGKLHSDMSGYHQGVKEVLQSNSLSGVRGTLAQLIQVPADLEGAFEAAIGGRLQDIVVNSWQDAEKAIELLKRKKSGRATFLPLDRLRPPKPLKAPAVDGVIGLATDLATFDDDIAPAAQNLLNRILVTKNLKAARSAFDKLEGGFQIVTRPGEVVRSGGAITGGETKSKRQQGGMLAREREWRELPEQIAGVNKQLESLQNTLADNKNAQTNIEETLAGLHRQKQTRLHQLDATRKEAAQYTAQLTDFSNRREWLQNLIAKTRRELESNQLNETEIEADVSRYQSEQREAETLAETLARELADLSAEALHAAVNQAQIEVSLVQVRQQNQRELLKTHKHNLNQLEAQHNSRQGRSVALGQERDAILSRLEAQGQEHATLLVAVKELTDEIEPSEATLKSLEQAQLAKERDESEQRDTLRRIESEHGRFALELARRQDDIDGLQRQIEDDFGLVQFELSADQVGQPLLPLQSMITQLPPVEELPEGIDEDIRHLKVQIRQLGHINSTAPDEYIELQERYDFLTHQMTDLESAAQDLKAVIAELDKIMQEAFMTTFTAVAKEFQSYFKILFGGGEAQLILTDEEDISKTGVDIIARPPGKRSQNLELLSGGERSLTAQALIFALLKTSPTPYCIFDEVDAMLDEANVDRFRRAIIALGKNIQFVIITHNRKTIEIADTIYGISMSDDAVSRVVSLKLENVELSDLN